jgi:hypothetical protein
MGLIKRCLTKNTESVRLRSRGIPKRESLAYRCAACLRKSADQLLPDSRLCLAIAYASEKILNEFDNVIASCFEIQPLDQIRDLAAKVAGTNPRRHVLR